MAIGWLTVLKLVPWTDVVKNAPVVVDGARKLWGSVAKTPDSPPPSRAEESGLQSGAPPALAAIEAQLAGVEASVAELRHQMRESTELIKTLAEQNAQLVERVETHRKRVLWLAGFAAVLGIFVAVLVARALASAGA